MKKSRAVVLLSTVLLLLIVPVVFAEEAAGSPANIEYYSMAVLGCGLAISIAAFGASIAQAMGLSKACEGIARNPGASGKITTTLIIGLAMIESLAIYALVVVLIILFMKPFGI